LLKTLVICLVLVLAAGVTAAITRPSAGAAPASAAVVPARAPSPPAVDDLLEVREVLAAGHAAAAIRAHVRAVRLARLRAERRLAQLLAERRTAAQRAARAAYRRRLLVNSSAEAWAHTAFAIRVANCESGGGPGDTSPSYDGDPYLRDPNGHDGKWQFAPETWASVGGTGSAADASVSEQDYRGWLLWKRDGWAPWQCAQIVN
jgi:hypothetical protein